MTTQMVMTIFLFACTFSPAMSLKGTTVAHLMRRVEMQKSHDPLKSTSSEEAIAIDGKGDTQTLKQSGKRQAASCPTTESWQSFYWKKQNLCCNRDGDRSDLRKCVAGWGNPNVVCNPNTDKSLTYPWNAFHGVAIDACPSQAAVKAAGGCDLSKVEHSCLFAVQHDRSCKPQPSWPGDCAGGSDMQACAQKVCDGAITCADNNGKFECGTQAPCADDPSLAKVSASHIKEKGYAANAAGISSWCTAVMGNPVDCSGKQPQWLDGCKKTCGKCGQAAKNYEEKDGLRCYCKDDKPPCARSRGGGKCFNMKDGDSCASQGRGYWGSGCPPPAQA